MVGEPGTLQPCDGQAEEGDRRPGVEDPADPGNGPQQAHQSADQPERRAGKQEGAAAERVGDEVGAILLDAELGSVRTLAMNGIRMATTLRGVRRT
jgi:hypothetical protein